MNAGYYDAILPVREFRDDEAGIIADLRLPYRTLASVFVPSGRIVVAFVSDSALLTRMFAANWARAGTDQEPDATLYALTHSARGYGLDDALDEARWWSAAGKLMVVFGFGSYRLAKVCIRGICSAVSGDDILFLHGCALTLGKGNYRRGVVITGSSGAGKTTLVAGLLKHAGLPVTVMNDDWGAVSLSSGKSVSTGERMLHMKSSSVLAFRPDFFSSAPRDLYSYDLSEPDRTARILVSPEGVYGTSWDPTTAVTEHLAAIVRKPPGWTPPRQKRETDRVLMSGGDSASSPHHEAFFNGSLILTTAGDELREEQRYHRLLNRTAVSWINNDSTPEGLVERFISAVMK